MGAMRDRVADQARQQADAYSGDEDRPLAGYARVMGVFGALVATAAGVARVTGRRAPADIRPWDVVLLAAGTHKLSRTIAKDAVTAPLRAPFTRYAGRGGPAEVMEEVRGTGGVRHSVGELLTCPFCLDVWIATGFSVGTVFAPRATRLVTATLTALTGADFLQLAYARAQQAAS